MPYKFKLSVSVFCLMIVVMCVLFNVLCTLTATYADRLLPSREKVSLEYLFATFPAQLLQKRFRPPHLIYIRCPGLIASELWC